MIRFVDLFAGIGGLRLGFEKASEELGLDCTCVTSSEIDKHAQKTYELNFGETPEGDIYNIRCFPKFDFLLAGFPCQPFSYAGKHQGFGDTRGTLFFEIERVLSQARPAGFLLENVRGLASHDDGRTLKTILSKLNALGYGTEVRILNSSEFGVPQNRVRLYILGLKNKIPKLNLQSNMGAIDSHDFKRKNSRERYRLVKDILESDVSRSYDCSPEFKHNLEQAAKSKKLPLNGIRLIDFRNGNSVHSWDLGLKGKCNDDEIALMDALVANRRRKTFGAHQDGKSLNVEQIKTFFRHHNLEEMLERLVKKRYLKNKDGRYNLVSGNMTFEVFKVLDPESIAITLVSSDAHKLGVFHEGRLRHLTPRECARLQGFPDSFLYHPIDKHAYRQFGNSVSIPVVKALVQDFLNLNDLSLASDQDNMNMSLSASLIEVRA